MTPTPIRRRTRPFRILPALVLLLVLGAVPAAAQETLADASPTVVFLVRHAEKAAEPADDPPLTDAGRARAETLVRMLADAGLDAVWSTDYVRTRETARPVAAATGIALGLYDPGDPHALARRLRRAGGRALVVGHSNTTPGLVAALGGDPGPPIGDDEYDRLYVVVLPGAREGPVVTTLLRFGARSGG